MTTVFRAIVAMLAACTLAAAVHAQGNAPAPAGWTVGTDSNGMTRYSNAGADSQIIAVSVAARSQTDAAEQLAKIFASMPGLTRVNDTTETRNGTLFRMIGLRHGSRSVIAAIAILPAKAGKFDTVTLISSAEQVSVALPAAMEIIDYYNGQTTPRTAASPPATPPSRPLTTVSAGSPPRLSATPPRPRPRRGLRAARCSAGAG